jgi:ABC-type branched-subunit amino acid transport system substrate-binding protein
MMKKNLKKTLIASAIVGAMAIAPMGAQAACTTTVGSVMALTGSLGALGQAIAKGAELAVSTVNQAGGVNGCQMKLALLDDQTNPAVGVSAAKQLVDINHVSAIVGALSSGVSMAILTSVTAPSKVVQISPSSTSPSFTALAKQGKTGGYWFRTAPSDALQSVAMAKMARDDGLKRVAVLYLKNPYGEGLAGEFQTYFKRMGGTITAAVPYNPKQPSYRSEVGSAMQGKPQAVFLIGYPGDGTTVAREWVSAGGPQVFLLPDGLESQKFVDDVGAKYMKKVIGTAGGSVKTPSLTTFNNDFKAKYGELPTQAYMTNAYDAVMVIALAMEKGKGTSSAVVKDNIRKVTGTAGEAVYAGAAGFEKAKKLIKEGKPFHYVGTVGELNFDKYGDTSGPMAIWTVKGGKVEQTGMMSVKAINAVIKKY